MSAALETRLEEILGARVQAQTRLHGGCIAEVSRVDLADGRRLVAKIEGGSEAGLTLEAYMLRYLAEHSSLPVPRVLHAEDDLLLLEHLPGSSTITPGAERHAAELLAELHGVSADAYGLECDTLIGALPQPNPQTSSWIEFFREHRLLYMTQVASRSGNLPNQLRRRLDRFAWELDEYLDEPPQPSLIHGDVWTSNVLVENHRITGFLDPALYYADAEMELAYITLFHTFSEPFLERYQELRPIRDGFFEQRRDIYSLYPLLVHVAHFGGSYARSVESTLMHLGF